MLASWLVSIGDNYYPLPPKVCRIFFTPLACTARIAGCEAHFARGLNILFPLANKNSFSFEYLGKMIKDAADAIHVPSPLTVTNGTALLESFGIESHNLKQ